MRDYMDEGFFSFFLGGGGGIKKDQKINVKIYIASIKEFWITKQAKI